MSQCHERIICSLSTVLSNYPFWINLINCLLNFAQFCWCLWHVFPCWVPCEGYDDPTNNCDASKDTKGYPFIQDGEEKLDVGTKKAANSPKTPADTENHTPMGCWGQLSSVLVCHGVSAGNGHEPQKACKMLNGKV